MKKYFDNFDDWFTAGNNWRFIALVGGLALIVIVLVFGSIIKKRAAEMSEVALIAAKPDTIAQVIEDTAPQPEPEVIEKIYTEYTIFCYGEGKECWDPKTDRLVQLGKPR